MRGLMRERRRRGEQACTAGQGSIGLSARTGRTGCSIAHQHSSGGARAIGQGRQHGRLAEQNGGARGRSRKQVGRLAEPGHETMPVRRCKGAMVRGEMNARPHQRLIRWPTGLTSSVVAAGLGPLPPMKSANSPTSRRPRQATRWLPFQRARRRPSSSSRPPPLAAARPPAVNSCRGSAFPSTRRAVTANCGGQASRLSTANLVARAAAEARSGACGVHVKAAAVSSMRPPWASLPDRTRLGTF